MKTRKIISVLCVAAFALSGCKANKDIQKGVNHNDNLFDKYWKLDQILGVDIVTLGKLPAEAYITFHAEENRVSGNLGCNDFGGNYELTSGNRIRFSELISTLKMCLGENVEDRMKQALNTADSYYLSNDTLILNRARMAPLARFIAVEKHEKK
jgi:heat shock protein HslJ